MPTTGTTATTALDPVGEDGERGLVVNTASIAAFEPTVKGVEYSPQFIQVAGASDVMVAASLELRLNERSFRMTICMPFSGLLPHLLRAAAP